MNSKVKNFTYALSANMINFFLGIVTGFLVPKFLGVESYGYFKIFTFYVSYVGLLHFGFIDGIYVKYGNYDYEDIPKEKFRGYFKFLLIQQIILAIILSIILLIYPGGLDRKLIAFFVLVNMIILNTTTFFSFICQFTKRFKVFSINTVLTKLIFVIGCILLFWVKSFNYLPYIIVQTICNLIILFMYMRYCKDLIVGEKEKIKNLFGDIKLITTNGLFIMLGNFVSLIIIGVDRMFVDRLFSLEDFAYYSFAYSLISLFYILSNSVKTVIYPYLSRVNKEQLNSAYVKIKSVVSIVLGVTLIGYFIIKFIVEKFMPDYIPSLSLFLYLTPTVLLNGQISILASNYFKVMNLTKEYTKNNIVAMILGFIFNVIGYSIFKSTVSIAVASLITFMVWVLYSDMFFSRKMSIKVWKNNIMEFIIVFVFIISSSFFNWYVGMIIYMLFCVLLILSNKSVISSIKEIVLSRKS